jgi:hypothetical protein
MAVASLAVAVLALLASTLSLLFVLRRWRHEEFLSSRESTPIAVLICINDSWWWRIANHGPRLIRTISIMWCDVDPPEDAVDPARLSWGIPPGGQEFVPAVGTPKAGRRML